jgi:Regulator of chromosome condensation (RCC1) repeat
VRVQGLTGVQAIAAGGAHVMALLGNGGSDDYGELGVGATGPELCGAARCSRVRVRVGVRGVGSVAAGWRFSLALSGGTILLWGTNELGQLGDGSTAGSELPMTVQGLGAASGIAAGEKHSLALLQSEGPPPSIELWPGPGSLTVSWRASEGSEPWGVSWRAVEHPAVAWADPRERAAGDAQLHDQGPRGTRIRSPRAEPGVRHQDPGGHAARRLKLAGRCSDA